MIFRTGKTGKKKIVSVSESADAYSDIFFGNTLITEKYGGGSGEKSADASDAKAEKTKDSENTDGEYYFYFYGDDKYGK